MSTKICLSNKQKYVNMIAESGLQCSKKERNWMQSLRNEREITSISVINQL